MVRPKRYMVVIVEFTHVRRREEVASTIEATINYVGERVSSFAAQLDGPGRYGAVEQFQCLTPSTAQE